MSFPFAVLIAVAAVFTCATFYHLGRNEGFEQGMAAGRRLERTTGRTQP